MLYIPLVLLFLLSISSVSATEYNKFTANSLDIPFIENHGQTNDSIYYAKTFYGTTHVSEKGIRHEINPNITLTETFTDCNGNPIKLNVTGIEASPTKVNIYETKGNWTNIKTWKTISLGEVWPGIKINLRAHEDNIEKIFIINSDPNNIRIKIEGAQLSIGEDGQLIITKGSQSVEMTKPIAFQDDENIPVEYIVEGDTYTFKVGDYDKSRELIIDPKLDYSTYLGGGNLDYAWDIYVDDFGCAYITGSTLNMNTGSLDVYLAKFDYSGSLIYYTIIGGSGDDYSLGVAADEIGNAYIVGETRSPEFLSWNTIGSDAFIFKFDYNGDIIDYMTFGGSNYDEATGITLDSNGNMYITGRTMSTDFPVTNDAYQKAKKGGYDMFIVKLDPSFRILYSSYIGGSKDDSAEDITIDQSDNIYIAGYTSSTDFPITLDALQGPKGLSDAVIVKFSPGMRIEYSTYIGGSDYDFCYGIHSIGDTICITGSTNSTDFPVTVGAYSRTKKGGSDIFITCINSTGDLIYSSYIGGSKNDIGYDITTDQIGNIYVTGATSSEDFPVTSDAYQKTIGGQDAFIIKLHPSNGLKYSTYFGGTGIDEGQGIKVDNLGSIYVTGITRSQNFPVTVNAYKYNISGLNDAFLSILGNFILSNLTVTPINGTTPLTIQANATIQNTGEISGEYTAILYINGYPVNSTLVYIPSGGSKTVSLGYTLTRAKDYNVTIGYLPPIKVKVMEPARLEISDLKVSPVRGVEPLNITATAKITNYGGLTGTYTAKLYVNGAEKEEKEITVAPYSSRDVSFNIQLFKGEYQIGINDLTPVNVTITEPDKFVLTNFTVKPDSGIAPLEIIAAFNLTNTDTQKREYTAILYVNGTVANNTKVTVDPMTTINVELGALITEPGVYNVTVNNMTPHLVNVLENPNIKISNVTIIPSEGEAPLRLNVNVTVTNTGDLTGDYTITLYKDDIAWDTRLVTVPGKGKVTVSMDKTIEEAGDYILRVNDESPVTIRVHEPPLTITGYSIEPQSGAAPLTIKALLNVTNPYDKIRSYNARLYIDGLLIQEKSENINPGETWELEMVAMLTAGLHNVKINDLPIVAVNVMKPAEFTLSNLTVTPKNGSAPLNITVKAKVVNTGDIAGNYTATLYIDGVAVSNKTINVAAGSTVTVIFNHTLEEPGDYLVGISYLEPVNVKVLKPPLFILANFTVTPQTGVAPLNVNASALIRNMEEGGGDYTATLYVNGVPADKKTLNIMGYGSAIVTFNTLLETSGTYTIRIDNSPTSTVTVLEPAKFIIQSFQVTPSQGVAPLTIKATATIKNVGGIAGNYMARLYIQGTAVATKTINIASNSNTTLTFDYTITQRGNYTIWIENSTRENVNVLKPATFEVSNLTVTPNSGSEPLNVTVTVNITNTGDLAGQYTAKFKVNGQVMENKTVTVQPGQTVKVTFNKLLSKGTYNVTVDNLNPVNVIVNAQLTYNEISTASKIIANEVSKTGKIPSKVTVGNKSISIDDYLYAAVVTTINLNVNKKTSITTNNYKPPTNPLSTTARGTLTKTAYLQAAQNIKKYMETNGRSPNYATTTIGKVNYKNIIYAYARIINFYNTYKRLPTSVKI